MTNEQKQIIIDELNTKIEEYLNFHDVDDDYIRELNFIVAALRSEIAWSQLARK